MGEYPDGYDSEVGGYEGETERNPVLSQGQHLSEVMTQMCRSVWEANMDGLEPTRRGTVDVERMSQEMTRRVGAILDGEEPGEVDLSRWGLPLFEDSHEVPFSEQETQTWDLETVPSSVAETRPHDYSELEMKVRRALEVIEAKVGPVEIDPLTRRHKAAADVVVTLIQSGLLEKVAVQKVGDVVGSVLAWIGEVDMRETVEAARVRPFDGVAWRDFAGLALPGQGIEALYAMSGRLNGERASQAEVETALRARRFGVLLPVPEGVELNSLNVYKCGKAVEAMLRVGFPWAEGERDFGLGEKVAVFDGRGWQQAEGGHDAVVVIYAGEEVDLGSEEALEARRKLLENNRVVVTVQDSESWGQNVHVQVNHEWTDAMQAKYLATGVMTILGSDRAPSTAVEFGEMVSQGESQGWYDQNTPEDLQARMEYWDRVVNLGVEGEDFCSESFEFGEEELGELNDLYRDLADMVAVMRDEEGKPLKLSWANFMQFLTLDLFDVNGQEVRAGALVYDGKKHLGQYAMGERNLAALVALVQGHEPADVAEMLDWRREDNDNIGQLIGKVADEVDSNYLRTVLAKLTDWRFMKAQRFLAGQVLVSVMYDGFVLREDEVDEGRGMPILGITDSALPEGVMDVAAAWHLVVDEKNRLTRAVLKLKRRVG